MALSLASNLVIQSYITHFTQKIFVISCFLNLALRGVVETGVAIFLSTVLQVKIAILEKPTDIDSSVNVAVLVHFCLDEKQQFES